MGEEAKAEEKEYTPKTDEELKQIAQDLWAGKIYTDRHIPEQEMPYALATVFMPLALMHPDDREKLFTGENKPTLIYEYLDKAGPRSVNGMPGFFSFHCLNEEETERMFRYYTAIQEAMDAL